MELFEVEMAVIMAIIGYYLGKKATKLQELEDRVNKELKQLKDERTDWEKRQLPWIKSQ